MNTKLKKLIPLFALASCFTATTVFAGEDTTNTPKAQYSVAPAKNPGGEDALAFYIQAAYTYWVPYQEGMNLAFATLGTTDTIKGNIIRPSIEGCSGFKVAIGANTMHDGWVVALNYTWFNNSPAMAVNTLTNGVTYEATFNDSTDPITAISTQWKNQFNRIDGQIDRTFYAGHYLTLRPWMGLLGTWDSQNLNANETETELSVSVNEEVRWQQNWWGIGPYAGVEASYFFTSEWALYISSGASMLLANHKLSQAEYTVVGGAVGPYEYNQADNFYNVEPMLESSLGLRWESFWTEWALCIDLAWEMQTYFSHNGFQTLVSPMGLMGNYSMQGLTAGVKVSF